MPHLWRHNGPDIGWTPTPLAVGRLALAPNAALQHINDESGGTWLLFAAPDTRVRVNGFAVTTGLVVLSDRDEIRLAGDDALYFSTETLATVGPFPETGPRGYCPRCRQSIEPNSPAVRCPNCSLYHHQSDDLSCWTYASTCANCPCDTALDAGFRWTPEDL